ncbi:AraC-like DNA-binding protein [Tenacibaculum skagerrakense]|uniref:AraC-like DNA-binding protein n=1 Tax=Tenacibaculum skagerrakense TaxID=186571 RepID=A0A4R2NY49_9FLAO|nr:AraC family transcriptional regulator [Tenacibaculum skagerrakense]TCP27002.1 AraC-like DNA-binding protein [Tenacibaculum skagerrakense]
MKNSKNLSLILLFFFYSLILISQANHQINDYKESETFRKMSEFKNTNLDSLLFYSDKGELSSNPCEKLIALIAKAYYHYRKNEIEKCKKVIDKTIQKVDSLLNINPKNICFTKIKLSTLNRLFWIHKNSEEYQKAYKNLLSMSDFLDNVKNKNFDGFDYFVNIENSKALIKKDLNQEEEAKSILIKIIKKVDQKINRENDFYDQQNLTHVKANTLYLLGQTYMALNKKTKKEYLLDSASICFEKAYNSAKKIIPPHPDSKLIYQFRKADILITKKEYKEALKLIDSLILPKNMDDIDYESEIYFYKTLIFNGLNKYDSIIYSAKKSLENNNLKGSRLITIYDILSNEYNRINELDSAIKYSKLTLKEFNFSKENKQRTYQLLYDNDLEKITELNNTIIEKEKKKNLTTTILYTLILVIISSFFLFKRKKYKKEISQKSDELEITIVNAKKDLEKEKSQSNKTIEKSKVNYNIEAQLEKKILDQLKQVEVNQAYLKHDFSINTIAEKVNTNSTYVSFVYNKHYDVPFKQYYTQKKIEYAVDLIKNKEYYKKYSIEGLANIVGYTNASAFSRAFKKYMNISPSEYIKNLSK